MKFKAIFALAISLSIGGLAQAQTYIEITGATAFRSAATNAINNAFAGAGPFAAAYNGANINGGNFQAWKGTFPGISGTTIIRTSWNGSVEGVRAVAVPGPADNAYYLKEDQIPAVPGSGNTITPISLGTLPDTAKTEQAVAEMAFSDVAQASTPVTGTLSGGPVGVVVFTMVANKTWRDDAAGDTAGLTNITGQQFRALATRGFQPLSYFSGNPTHTNRVYLTGRNDGSGTRTTYLAETGFGVSKPVNQYISYDSNSTTISKILYTPKGGGFGYNVTTPTASIASTIWGQDQDGNGGYSSGSTLRDDLKKTTASTAVWAYEDLDSSGNYDPTEDDVTRSAQKLYLVSWISYADAQGARSAGAQILGYNGVRLDDLEATFPSSISANDKAKITNGLYTAWGYEQLLHVTGNPTVSGVFTTLKNALTPSLLGSTGIALTEMNVSRTTDGGTVAP